MKMKWWCLENFKTKQPNLLQRAAVLKAIRTYFDDMAYIEVETPALQVMPCADMHIHGFYTEYFGPDLNVQKGYYLHTSPEFEMKKLLVAGMSKIFQICKVFRNAENGRLHSPEFTMLEWYRAGADYLDIMQEVEGVVQAGAQCLGVDVVDGCALNQGFERISVMEAFDKYANINLEQYLNDTKAFASAAKAQDVRVIESDSWDDIFHAVMAEKIERYLGHVRPTFLYDYPAAMACLSKRAPDPRFAERFELYVCGVELANAFSELTDAAEQRKRFEAEMAAKQERYGFSYPLDEDFLHALDSGMPESAGVALGLDRLIMLLVGSKDIDDVLWTGKPHIAPAI